MAKSRLYLVYREPGPGWVAGQGTREQPLWDEHAVFMDRLFEEGRIVLAGPYADEGRALVVMEARDAAEAANFFLDDPWVRNGILLTADAIEWTIFLDSRRAHNPSA